MAATKSKLIAPTDPKTHTEQTHTDKQTHTHTQTCPCTASCQKSGKLRQRVKEYLSSQWGREEGGGRRRQLGLARHTHLRHVLSAILLAQWFPVLRFCKYLLLSAEAKTKQSASTKHSHQLLSRFCTCKSRSSDACELRSKPNKAQAQQGEAEEEEHVRKKKQQKTH